VHYYKFNIADFDECTETRISKMPMVYALSTYDLGYIKIGMTKNLKQRFSNIQSGCPFNLTPWLAIRCPTPAPIEKDLHKLMSHCRLRGEWFTPCGEDQDRLIDYFRETNKSVRAAFNASL
jgi:hypothetical protein